LTALQTCSPDSFCSCTTLRAVYVPYFYRVRLKIKFLFSSSFASWCAKPGSGSHREKDRKKQIPATLPTVSQTCSLESCCSPMTLRAVNVPYVCSLRFCFSYTSFFLSSRATGHASGPGPSAGPLCSNGPICDWSLPAVDELRFRRGADV